MKVRLTEWAAREGISYTTALRWAKAGKVPGLSVAPTGRLFVEVADNGGLDTVLYGRVSSSDQRGDLARQMDRLRAFASSRGLVVANEVMDIGSGLNGHRKKLIAIMRNPKNGVIIVEHRDRLARFGVEYIEATLIAQGRSLLVMNEGEQKLDLVQDFIDVVTSMCSRIYGRRAAKSRAERAVAAAAEAQP